MAVPSRYVLVAAAIVAATAACDASARRTTVCTVTVNSPDEREAFRRDLPAERFEFVELVERGRPDWLASACRMGVQCDVLVISGHFDGGDEFYSDRLDARESLPVDEMERAACSDSCQGLFSQLKEVYLFGCNTLNPDAASGAPDEIARSLVRAGQPRADAEQLARALRERYPDSNRDRMREIFKDVPVIYGFSSKAPLGRSAAPLLDRYFAARGADEVAGGKPSAKLLGLFAPASMTVAAGQTADDVQSAHRRDVCRLASDRSSAAQKLRDVHELLTRDAADVRMFLDRLEKYTASLSDADRRDPAAGSALEAIARDASARRNWLAFARNDSEPAARVRMIELAAKLGWLTPAEQHAEIARMFGEQVASGDIGPAEVDLACALNRDGAFDGAAGVPDPRSKGTGRAAIFACLGNAGARARMLQALTSAVDADVEVAQVYLRHRPIADAAELRAAAAAIATMSDPQAQVRALDALARQPLSDRESLDALAGVFVRAKTVDVQRAVAGVLIRADYAPTAKPALAQALRKHRLKSPDGQDMIDALIRRLQQAPSPSA